MARRSRFYVASVTGWTQLTPGGNDKPATQFLVLDRANCCRPVEVFDESRGAHLHRDREAGAKAKRRARELNAWDREQDA